MKSKRTKGLVFIANTPVLRDYIRNYVKENRLGCVETCKKTSIGERWLMEINYN